MFILQHLIGKESSSPMWETLVQEWNFNRIETKYLNFKRTLPDKDFRILKQSLVRSSVIERVKEKESTLNEY